MLLLFIITLSAHAQIFGTNSGCVTNPSDSDIYNFFTAHGQHFGTNSGCVTNPPNFTKLSFGEACEAANDEERQKICPEYITNLVSQLRQGHLSNDNQAAAIYLLGELRPTDSNSIQFLIENIDFKSSKMATSIGLVRWGCYPAQESLIKIGTPTVNAILCHLPIEDNEVRRHLMCDVLINVEGKKGVYFNEAEGKKVVQGQIKDRLANESDPAKRANLELALKELEK